jgi:selenocysteine lyase/cysteine desulfurase
MSSVPAADAAASSTSVPPRIDVARERRATAGSTLARHFNAAGAALPSVGVVGTVVDHLRREEAKGGYEAAAEMRESTERVYESAAALIGASAHEIALFDSASSGLRAILDALRPGRGQRIVASSSTYVSHALHIMSLSREHDIELVIAPTDASRQMDLGALEQILSDGKPTIVTVAHIPTSSGLVEPVAAIGEIVKRYGGTYILDATQSVGHLVTDVNEIGCDVLVTTGRKFLRGPRGTGFTYVRRELAESLPPIAPDVRGAQWNSLDGWDLDASARRFESWESAIAARLGLGTAIDEAMGRGMDATETWLQHAGVRLRVSLNELSGVRTMDPDRSGSAIVTFVVDGVDPSVAVQQLAERGVRVVSVPATHGQWDLGDRGVHSVVRASPHVYNDEDDEIALVESVAALDTVRERA